MKFYALVVWRTRGVMPRLLQLVYLGNGEVLRYEPEERDLLATERKLRGAVGRDPAGQRGRRVAAEPVDAVRLVRPPGDLPGVGWHSSPAARGARLIRRGHDRAGVPSRQGGALSEGESVQVAGDLDVTAGRSSGSVTRVEDDLDPVAVVIDLADTRPEPRFRVLGADVFEQLVHVLGARRPGRLYDGGPLELVAQVIEARQRLPLAVERLDPGLEPVRLDAWPPGRVPPNRTCRRPQGTSGGRRSPSVVRRHRGSRP